MKANKMFWFAVAAATFATNAFAQTDATERPYFPDIITIQKADYSKLEKKYAACLSSENEGVVESALAHIAMFKLMYPVKEFGILERAVKVVADQNPSPEIRYRAYLVSSLYENPKQFVNEARTSYSNPDELFDALASRMNQAIVSRMEK